MESFLKFREYLFLRMASFSKFREYLFLRMENFLKFREYLFLQIAGFWKFQVYKFWSQRKKNKKKTGESRDIRLMFLSKSTKRQAGRDRKTAVMDWLQKSYINQHFLWIFFFVYIFSQNMKFVHIWRAFIFVKVV